MKREDGTARLLEGDTDRVVRQIADLYIERNDALKSQDPSYRVTITTLTNAEAADISQAIRERLKARGEIGTDEATYKAVVYRSEKREFFDLPIATGDRLRMYRKTVAEIDGKRATIGNNGDIVEVVRKTPAGLVLRNARDQTAEIDWKRLSDPKTGRLPLGVGHAFTIDAAQGMSTKGEHIHALPHGTAATSAFKTYTAESRATGRTHTLISKAAVHAAVQRSRALGDVTPMTEDDLLERGRQRRFGQALQGARARHRRQSSPTTPPSRRDWAVQLQSDREGRRGAALSQRRDKSLLSSRASAPGFRAAARRPYGADADDRRAIETRRRRPRRPCQGDGDGDQGRACPRAGGSQSARTAGAGALGARPKLLRVKAQSAGLVSTQKDVSNSRLDVGFRTRSGPYAARSTRSDSGRRTNPLRGRARPVRVR
jgi:hypothetical protein